MKTEYRKIVGSVGIPVVSENRFGTGRTISGFAALYNSPSLDLGGFVEFIEPGTFEKALHRDGDVLALVDHEQKRILGRRSAGTLRLMPNMLGLRYEIDAPDTTYANDLVESIRRRDISGSSFGFRVRADRWEKRFIGGKATRVRILLDLDLVDVSAVVSPAYPATSVYVGGESTGRSAQMRANVNRLRLAEAELVGGVR